MFRLIKFAAIGGMFVTCTAFAHGHHGHYGQGGYGYNHYYRGYGPTVGYYSPQPYYVPMRQPYYAPPPVPYGGYAYNVAPVISIPFFGGGWGHAGYGGHAGHGHHHHR